MPEPITRYYEVDLHVKVRVAAKSHPEALKLATDDLDVQTDGQARIISATVTEEGANLGVIERR